MSSIVGRVLGEGFRIFFLAAGIYGVFTGIIWTMYLAGIAEGPLRDGVPVLWHAHEMIFGYATAAIGGFFLTAVPNWTNTPGARRGFITLAAGLWLGGRLAVWYSGMMPPVWVAVLDLAFIPVLAIKILSQLVKRPKPQNIMFLLFLTYLWIADLLVHLEWLGITQDSAQAGLRGGLTSICALISVLGGRVTPAFTRNAMKRSGVAESHWPRSFPLVERTALILALALPPLVMLGTPAWGLGPVAILFGLVQALRLSRWGGIWCLGQPILWSLHLGLAMLALGMVLWGLSALGIGREIAGLHVLGIGCVGGMTLAVMSRASLGHSGRELVAPFPMILAYALMAVAALLRWVGAELDGAYLVAMLVTGGLWVTAFALYIASMWAALTGPRFTAT